MHHPGRPGEAGRVSVPLDEREHRRSGGERGGEADRLRSGGRHLAGGGPLAAVDGDPDRAVDLHHQALAERVEHGLRTFYVDSLDALATLDAGAQPTSEAVRVLAASDQAREAMAYPRAPPGRLAHNTCVERLRAALGEGAFAEAWAEGAGLTLEEAVAYVRRARGSRGRPATGWDSLTPTELEVVRLVVDGLSNPEIGRRLFMSRGTVKAHLSHVYAKLGVANRTELATHTGQRLRPTPP